MDRQIGRHIYIQSDRKIDGRTAIQTYMHTIIETNRQTVRQSNIQTRTYTHAYIDIHTYIMQAYRQTNIQTV